MNEVRWFSQGFFAMAGAYVIPLWIAHTYFNASDVVLCYVLVAVQAIVTFAAAIAQIIRSGGVVKWIISAISAVVFNTIFLYMVSLVTGVQVAIVVYVIIGSSLIGKATMEHFRFINEMKRILSMSDGISTRA